jgi:hypothetical protein
MRHSSTFFAASDKAFSHINVLWYNIAVTIITLTYIAVSIGLLQFQGTVKEKILQYARLGVQWFVCLVLLIRFNPLRDTILQEYDSTLIFGASTLLLTNLLTQLVVPQST